MNTKNKVLKEELEKDLKKISSSIKPNMLIGVFNLVDFMNKLQTSTSVTLGHKLLKNLEYVQIGMQITLSNFKILFSGILNVTSICYKPER